MTPATEALGLDRPRAAVCSRVEGFTLLGGAPGKTPVLYRSTIGVANGLGHRLPTIGIRRIIAFIEEKALKRLCALRSGARRFRRHNVLEFSIGAAI